MTELILCPTTTTNSEATDYVVLFPHHGTYHILWRMWCSSRRWAIQDAAQDFSAFLNEMFPDGVRIHYKHFASKQEIVELCATLNLAQKYDLRHLAAVRAKFSLPPWSHEADQYQNIQYEV